MPKVSIITAFLNGQRFLAESVQSVFAQTSDDWELLLIDDGSTDASTAYARRLASEHPLRIRYIEHAGHANRGLPASRNVGIRQARGEYLTFLDADDIWLPEKLARQMAVLDEHPTVAMVYGPLLFWYGWTGDPADMKQDFICPMGTQYNSIIEPPAMLVRQIESTDGLPGTCSVLLRHEVAVDIGGFEESFGMYEDEVFFSKIALRFPVYVIPEALDRYRQHPDSFCAKALQAGEWTMSQGPENKARERYLRWLADFIASSGFGNKSLTDALRVQLSQYEKT